MGVSVKYLPGGKCEIMTLGSLRNFLLTQKVKLNLPKRAKHISLRSNFTLRSRISLARRANLTEKHQAFGLVFFWWGMVDSICVFFRLRRKKIKVRRGRALAGGAHPRRI